MKHTASSLLRFLPFLPLAVLLTQCSTVKDGTLTAYDGPPTRTPDQVAVIDLEAAGSRQFQMKLNDRLYHVGTSFKRIAVAPGDVLVSGFEHLGTAGRRTVRLEAGHRYAFMKLPVVRHRGRVLSPRQAASEVKSRSGLPSVEVGLGDRRFEHHQALLETYFKDHENYYAEASASVRSLLNEYQRSYVLVVKDLATHRYFTGSDPQEQQTLSLLKHEIPSALGDDTILGNYYSLPQR